jgi:DNA-3-methyladenine glycosylase II
MNQFTIQVPAEFNYQLCFDFLKRSPKEILHQVDQDRVIKWIRLNEQDILFEVSSAIQNEVIVNRLNGELLQPMIAELESYVRKWFDLDTDLTPFYVMAQQDKLLKPLVEKYYGYRIIGQPDLFESLIWAVLGQQINLSFAYTLKQRFVEQFGQRLIFQGRTYFLFPTTEVVAKLSEEHLLPLQFSKQKSKYVKTIAEAFLQKEITQEQLASLPFETAKEKLMTIKGVGNWTANYALMKTFRYKDAFPLEDAGVHNAIKNLKKMKTKPTLDQVKRIFKKYRGWEAYATLYFWKSL